jgi:hypothetical protein
MVDRLQSHATPTGERHNPENPSPGQACGAELPRVDVDAIRARLAKASSKPWQLAGTYPDVTVLDGTADSRFVAECSDTDDASFIAHASADVPALCDEVERLRAELAKTEQELVVATKFVLLALGGK